MKDLLLALFVLVTHGAGAFAAGHEITGPLRDSRFCNPKAIDGEFEVRSVQCLDANQQEVPHTKPPDGGYFSIYDSKIGLDLRRAGKRKVGGCLDVDLNSEGGACVISTPGARDALDSLHAVRVATIGELGTKPNNQTVLTLRPSAFKICEGNQDGVLYQVLHLNKVVPNGPPRFCSVYGPGELNNDRSLLFEQMVDGESIIVGDDRCPGRLAKSSCFQNVRFEVLKWVNLTPEQRLGYGGRFYYKLIYREGNPSSLEAGRILENGRLVARQYSYPHAFYGYPGKAHSGFKVDCSLGQDQHAEAMSKKP